MNTGCITNPCHIPTGLSRWSKVMLLYAFWQCIAAGRHFYFWLVAELFSPVDIESGENLPKQLFYSVLIDADAFCPGKCNLYGRNGCSNFPGCVLHFFQCPWCRLLIWWDPSVRFLLDEYHNNRRGKRKKMLVDPKRASRNSRDWIYRLYLTRKPLIVAPVCSAEKE